MKHEKWLMTCLTVIAMASLISAYYSFETSTSVEIIGTSTTEMAEDIHTIGTKLPGGGTDPGDDVPDGVSRNSGEDVSSWITNYYMWQAGNTTHSSKAFSLNGSTLAAINAQAGDSVSGQVSTRVYYGITERVAHGTEVSFRKIRTIIMPVDG